VRQSGVVDEHVGRLQVAMQDAALVGVGHRVAHGGEGTQHGRHVPAGRGQREPATAHQFGDEVGHSEAADLLHAGVQHPHDRRMFEAGDDAGFFAEAFDVDGIAGVQAEQLDRREQAVVAVPALVDRAARADADRAQQHVLAHAPRRALRCHRARRRPQLLEGEQGRPGDVGGRPRGVLRDEIPDLREHVDVHG
jgi:hypothetical protein